MFSQTPHWKEREILSNWYVAVLSSIFGSPGIRPRKLKCQVNHLTATIQKRSDLKLDLVFIRLGWILNTSFSNEQKLRELISKEKNGKARNITFIRSSPFS
jgi:hypothetical protein